MIPVYRSLADIGPEIGPSAVSIGNFDGVHTGHQAIFRRLVQVAAHLGLKSTVLTFNPHPTRVVAPERAPKMLSTPAQRYALMEDIGIEQIVELPFTEAISHLSAEAFVREILLEKLQTRAVLVGSNFRFGHRQAGDIHVLQAMGAAFGIEVEIVNGVKIRRHLVSSTEIRNAIAQGNVSLACRMLGRPYSIEGDVVPGHGIGSKKTVPTLNLRTDAEVLPANGVYITRTENLRDGQKWPSITNIGMRPTFDGDALTIETYLLAPIEGMSPERIRIEFLKRVRDERKFPSAEALKAQIMKDVQRAQSYFRRTALILKVNPQSKDKESL
ncbi:MAG TPA: bifunctional riboflavin kinase/FAD synthetase [Bryobacteraceae bacterium]|nr:bifunctional riboflavin kinase/FAD synthetase [Bryobacteraceae bacterium]